MIDKHTIWWNNSFQIWYEILLFLNYFNFNFTPQIWEVIYLLYRFDQQSHIVFIIIIIIQNEDNYMVLKRPASWSFWLIQRISHMSNKEASVWQMRIITRNPRLLWNENSMFLPIWLNWRKSRNYRVQSLYRV